MQFQLLIDQALRSNINYQQLSQKLIQKQERCMKKAESEHQRNKCKSKRDHFEQYFEQYTTQFKEKGRNMCSNAMKQHRALDQKFRLKDECVAFYAKSLPLFESNVVDKLKSLVQNTDFSEL